MGDTCFIFRQSRSVVAAGAVAFAPVWRVGTDIELSVGFLTEEKDVAPLPTGSTGRLILKPVGNYVGAARWLVASWTVTGEGAARRYHFRARLDSDLLRGDLQNAASAQYLLTVEYTAAGMLSASDDIAVTVLNNGFQGSDAAPDLPLGGNESVEFHAEIFPPGAEISAGTYYAGNVHRGGELHSVRLSVQAYQPGSTVQILIDGETELFTEPVVIGAQTQEWTQDDVVNKLAVTELANGARLDVVTTYTPAGEYTTPPDALELDIALRSRATVEQEGWEWLKDRIVGGQVDDEAQTITVGEYVIVEGETADRPLLYRGETLLGYLQVFDVES